MKPFDVEVTNQKRLFSTNQIHGFTILKIKLISSGKNTGIKTGLGLMPIRCDPYFFKLANHIRAFASEKFSVNFQRFLE